VTRLIMGAFAILALAACTTVDPATTVAQIEIGYTPLATAAAATISSGAVDKSTADTLRQLNDAIDTKGADGQRHGLLVAARTAAMNGDSVVSAAAIEALKQGVAALAGYETQKGIAHK
jgi:hypothetical protein